MASPVMTSQQVDSLMQQLSMEKLKANIIDDIIARVKTEHSSRTNSTSGSAAGEDLCPSPQTDTSLSPTSAGRKPYQAWVEDEEVVLDSTSNKSFNSSEVTLRPPMWSSDASSEVSTAQSPSLSTSDLGSSVASNTSSSQRDSDSTSNGVHTPPSPRPVETKPRLSVHFDRRPVILHNRSLDGTFLSVPTRPPMPERASADSGMSAVDLKWGKLFDERGEPTKRLGHVLRGLAKYLNVKFTPVNTLVITPEKLSTFYDWYSIETEPNILRRCEYHLVQNQVNAKPCVPGLTPTGFEQWATLLIRAYPDREAKRLAHVMTDLPIEAEGSTFDGSLERLPKQLSRSLLPAKRHEKSYDLVKQSLAEWARSMGVSPPSSPIFVPPSPRESLSHLSVPDNVRRYVVEEPGNGQAPRSRKVREYHMCGRDNGGLRAEQYEKSNAASSRSQNDRHHRPHSPNIVNQYRSSAPAVNGQRSSSRRGSSSQPIPWSAAAHPVSNIVYQEGDRSRQDEYRFLQGRDPQVSLESQPRTPTESSSMLCNRPE
ncbi:hypothetical protein B0I35DRAFT_408440 [Stachybotrys elegans]|uniref:DUF7514 domain-containing protein n=1 Tax=Stachybotrys elegans TaxID=80388 RepID=A0A8K0SSI9_9HYPO|nr:hypothetical protein B0I35DRAFT_408440 [Stachybotrys elegans]